MKSSSCCNWSLAFSCGHCFHSVSWMETFSSHTPFWPCQALSSICLPTSQQLWRAHHEPLLRHLYQNSSPSRLVRSWLGSCPLSLARRQLLLPNRAAPFSLQICCDITHLKKKLFGPVLLPTLTNPIVWLSFVAVLEFSIRTVLTFSAHIFSLSCSNHFHLSTDATYSHQSYLRRAQVYDLVSILWRTGWSHSSYLVIFVEWMNEWMDITPILLVYWIHGCALQK